MGFSVKRGTNISHWLSQSEKRGKERREWFTREDVRFLAGAGFDHLRLPVDEEQMWDAAGKREGEAFELLNRGLDWCEEAGMGAVVDLHILRSHHFLDKQPALYERAQEAERFAGLWRDLSRGLRGRSVERVAFELMNEPVAKEAADWNRVAKGAYDVLRAEEAGRVIVLASNRWNSVDTFDELWVPADGNVMLTFHYYHPLLVTHHLAPWHKSTGAYAGAIAYPGKPVAEEDVAGLEEPLRGEVVKENGFFDRGVMEADLAKPLAARGRTGCALYCGEFGVINKVADDIRVRWYRDFVSVLEGHGIGWANWDFCGSFGIVEGEGRRVTAVLRGLMG